MIRVTLKNWHLANLLGFPLRRSSLVGFVLASLLFCGQAFGVEFTDPPGQNVDQQEARLKEEIARYAKSVVGEDLIDVVVDIGYAKTGGGQGKIKLPGFNRFMDPSSKDNGITAEFLRVRQVFVMVSPGVGEREQNSLKDQLISQAKFDRTKGDRLEVVPVGAQDDKTGELGSMPQPGGKKRRGFKAPPANEPESTVYLLRARDAYFKKDFERSLRNILKALNVEPNSAQAYAMLGSVYYTLNWKTLALRYWQQSLQLDPDNRELEELMLQIEEQKS